MIRTNLSMCFISKPSKVLSQRRISILTLTGEYSPFARENSAANIFGGCLYFIIAVMK